MHGGAEFIRRYDHAQCVFYVDPPYPHDCRTARATYRHEMTDDQHGALLSTLAGIAGKFLLSSYPNPLYDQFAQRHGWLAVDLAAHNRASSAAVKEKKIERLYLNYQPVTEV